MLTIYDESELFRFYSVMNEILAERLRSLALHYTEQYCARTVSVPCSKHHVSQ